MRLKDNPIICIVVVFLLVGCGTTREQQTTTQNTTPPIQAEQKLVQVTIDVYSGQPNPSWKLSSAQVTELAHRLTQLSTIAQDPGDGGLGYRGFVIQNEDRMAGIPLTVRVFHKTVTVTDANQIKVYSDTQNITVWLQDQARTKGHGDIIDMIKGY